MTGTSQEALTGALGAPTSCIGTDGAAVVRAAMAAAAAAASCHFAMLSRRRCCCPACTSERRNSSFSPRHRASLSASCSSNDGEWVPRVVCFTHLIHASLMASTHD